MVRERPVPPEPRRSDGEPTVLAMPRGEKLLIFLGMPALGLLLGLAVPPVARWAIGLSIGLPVRPLFRLIAGVDRSWEVAICLTVGALLGLGVALVTMTESMTVTLTDTELHLDRNDRARTIVRSDVAAVFVDGGRLVVLDRDSRQLVRDPHRLSRDALARGFRAHGYPWQDADPYAGLYRRWTPETADLPAAVNAVLAARKVALKKKAGAEIHDLGDAVEKLGFAVREDGATQYWRPLVRS